MNELVPIKDRSLTPITESMPARIVTKLATSNFARYAFDLACSLKAACQPCQQNLGIEDKIADAQELIGFDDYKALAAAVAPLLETATVAQIKTEIAMLLAAFPTKDDLMVFTALAINEIASEPPTRLMLAAACRELRRTAKFRPSIAEILQALRHVERNTSLRLKARLIVGLPRYIGRARQILDERQEGEK